MKYRNPKTGEFKDLVVKVTDTLPVGSIVDYEGENIPEGWELVSENESIKTIKKIENNLAVPGMILNEESTSDKNAYSADYINNKLKTFDNLGKVLNEDSTSTKDTYSADYINKLKTVVLYENAEGASTQITLKERISNYKYIDIYFRDAANLYNSVTIRGEYNQYVSLQTVQVDSNVNLFKINSKNVYVQGNLITNAGKGVLTYTNNTPSVTYDNTIYIVKVTGRN